MAAILGSALATPRGFSSAPVPIPALSEERVATLFRPPLAQQASLSPDARHVAYTKTEGANLTVVVHDVDTGKPRVSFIVDRERVVLFSKEKRPASLRFLGWSTATRIVFAPTPYTLPAAPFPDYQSGGTMPNPGGPIIVAPIFSANIDSTEARQLVDSSDFAVLLGDGPPEIRDDGRPPLPTVTRYRSFEILGFAPGDRDHLLLEVRGFRQGKHFAGTEVVRIDVRTGKAAHLGQDVPFGKYLYDRGGVPRLHVSTDPSSLRQQYHFRHARGTWMPLEKAFPALPRDAFRTSAHTYYGERALPLGFDSDLNRLIFASNIDRDTFGIYAARAGSSEAPQRLAEAQDADFIFSAQHQPTLVFDEFRGVPAGVRGFAGPRPVLWIDHEFPALEGAVEKAFPGSEVELLNWSENRARFLLRVSGSAEPGRLFVYLRAERKLKEVARAAPWLEAASLHRSRPFRVAVASEEEINGTVTEPHRFLGKRPPLAIVFAPDFPATPHPTFDPEPQVLADMGFVVARINQRGTLGFGRRHADVSAGLETLAAADAKATLTWAQRVVGIDPRRVILVGHGFGGYLALRTLQLCPDLFRSVVALDAPLEPAAWLPDTVSRDLVVRAKRLWLERGLRDVHRASVLANLDTLSHPVFLAAEVGANESSNRSLHARLKAKGEVSELVEIHQDFSLGLPGARARLYSRLQEFLNLHVNSYRVDVGDLAPIQ